VAKSRFTVFHASYDGSQPNGKSISAKDFPFRNIENANKFGRVECKSEMNKN